MASRRVGHVLERSIGARPRNAVEIETAAHPRHDSAGTTLLCSICFRRLAEARSALNYLDQHPEEMARRMRERGFIA